MPSPIFGNAVKGRITYQMQGNLQTEPFKDKRLECAGKDKPYFIVTYNSSNQELKRTQVKKLWYDFVMLPDKPDIVYIRKERFSSKQGAKTDRGHSSLAQGQNVIAAGSVYFDENGLIKSWENKSGHYYFGMGFDHKLNEHVKSQMNEAKCGDQTELLPVSKFVAWDGDL